MNEVHQVHKAATNCMPFYLFYREVTENEEFLALPANQVAHLISSDRLSVPSEEQVGVEQLNTTVDVFFLHVLCIFWLCIVSFERMHGMLYFGCKYVHYVKLEAGAW